ncbi:hypothetical protein S245_019415 [Arachis hypogaea]
MFGKFKDKSNKGKSIKKFVGFVDAVYFIVVTLSTIGYGDITPISEAGKVFTMLLALLCPVVSAILESYLKYILRELEMCLVEKWEGGMLDCLVVNHKIGYWVKFFLALLAGPFVFSIGAFIVHHLEKMSWLDSFYFSVISITTVGYGNYSFRTTVGKCVVCIWFLFSSVIYSFAISFLIPCILRPITPQNE